MSTIGQPQGAAGIPEPAPWSNPPGTRAVFLVDTSSKLERRIVQNWIDSTRPGESNGMAPSLEIAIGSWIARKQTTPVKELADLIEGGDMRLYFIPVRVLWFPRMINGERRARIRDLLLGDPRQPFALRQKLIYKSEPERCYPVAGAGSVLPDLLSRFEASNTEDNTSSATRAEFILRMATLALERAERTERGARYKVPRLVPELILNEADFRNELSGTSNQLGLTYKLAEKKAESCLKEMAADHQTLFIDMLVSLARYVFRRGYNSQIDYLDEDVARIRALTHQYPVAFLMTHKSYLDGLVMALLVYDLDLPPLHLIGGANLNFAVAGTFSRKAGTLFIRRTFQNDPVYKLVLRHYIKYLVNKRFPLNWAFEGTRSRTGKLTPPRYGMLRYVADAALESEHNCLQLIPVSIAYDQLPDVSEYISEHRGAEKQKESLSFIGKFMEKLSRPYGKIHVRFGDAVVIDRNQAAKTEGGWEIDNLAMQKLAFKVAVEANRVTPVTFTSLIVFSLLENGYRALTLAELSFELRGLESLLDLFGYPKTGDFDINNPNGLRSTLQALTENHILTSYEDGVEPVYAIETGSKVAAAYYRNNIVHFFVNNAIVELALVSIMETSPAGAEQIFAEALKLRDLLKFEFFFEDRELFLAEIEHILYLRSPGWKARIEQGKADLDSLGYVVAHGALRAFIEAYRIAAEVLMLNEGFEESDVKGFLARCVTLGRQMVLQQRVLNEDSLTKLYFGNAFKLAQSRGLLNKAAAAERRVFREELAHLCDHLDYVARTADRQRIKFMTSASKNNTAGYQPGEH